MKFKKILSSVVATSMVLSSLTAFAAKTNTVDVISYIGDEAITGNVFVGETVKTVVGIEGMPDYTAYDLGFKYNNSVIQLASLAETTPSDVYDFETEDVDIDLSPYSTTKLTKIRSYALPNYGAIISQRKTASTDYTDPQTAVDDHTDLFTIEFKATAAGTSDFVWLNGDRDGWDIFDIVFEDVLGSANADFCLFPGVALTKDVLNFTVVDAPADPTGVDWAAGEGVYTVNWTEPATGCRGYEVIVYVNGNPKGTPVTVTDTTYDLLAEGIIGELTTGDMVKVSVKALGGVGSNAVETPEKEITGTPLEDITPVMGENEVLTWNDVENAAQYIIDVYDSNNNKVAESITVSGDETSCDLSGVITVDDYTIKIVADGNSPLYINSEKTISYSTGATIIGKVKADLGDDALTPNPNHKTKVTLINDATGDEYWDECDADGSFAIAGVPGDITNGISYSVKIERTSSLTRTQFGRYNDKLLIKKSVTHNICKNEDTPLTIYVGDVKEDASLNIQSPDLTELGTLYLLEEGDTGFDSKYDVVAGDGIISGNDILVIINNYNKGVRTYQMLADYNFTIAE